MGNPSIRTYSIPELRAEIQRSLAGNPFLWTEPRLERAAGEPGTSKEWGESPDEGDSPGSDGTTSRED